jgi:hypothetical protein
MVLLVEEAEVQAAGFVDGVEEDATPAAPVEVGTLALPPVELEEAEEVAEPPAGAAASSSTFIEFESFPSGGGLTLRVGALDAASDFFLTDSESMAESSETDNDD